jgi:hypothetical protein
MGYHAIETFLPAPTPGASKSPMAPDSTVASGHRYYIPSLGRWLARDPLEERGDLNVYAFALNQPLNWADLIGLKSFVVLTAGDSLTYGGVSHSGVPFDGYWALLEPKLKALSKHNYVGQLVAGNAGDKIDEIDADITRLDLGSKLHEDCEALVNIYLAGINTINASLNKGNPRHKWTDSAIATAVYAEWIGTGAKLITKARAVSPPHDILVLAVTIPPVSSAPPHKYTSADAVRSRNITGMVNGRMLGIPPFVPGGLTSASWFDTVDLGLPTGWIHDGLHHDHGDNENFAVSLEGKMESWLNGLSP